MVGMMQLAAHLFPPSSAARPLLTANEQGKLDTHAEWALNRESAATPSEGEQQCNAYVLQDTA